MKKTFVLSYLLLAAFIGSAEAKTIDAAYNAGPGNMQLSVYPGAKILNDLNSSMEWLLAFYFGTEAENQFLDPDNTSTDSSESPSTKTENEENAGEELWLAYNMAGMRYASSFIDPSISITIIPVSTTIRRYEPAGGAKEPYVINHKPAGQPHVVNKPSGFVPPEIIIPGGPKPFPWRPAPPNKPFNPVDDVPLPNPDEELPEIVNSPAPVPEPATMLLFSAGIAGLAIGGARRNKTAGTEKKG